LTPTGIGAPSRATSGLARFVLWRAPAFLIESNRRAIDQEKHVMRTSKIPAQKRWNTRYFLASAAAVLAAVTAHRRPLPLHVDRGALGTGTTWDTASTYWTSGSGNVAWPNTGNEIASFNASPGGTTISVATGIVLSAGGTARTPSTLSPAVGY